MNTRLRALALALALTAGGQAQAGDAETLMARWYASLEAADGESLAAIMDGGAEIVLNDIGIVQTKAEFLDSMSEWADAIDGGSIRHRIDGGSLDAGLTVAACYRFTSGEMLNTEVFAFREGRILRSEQTKVADACDGF